MASRPCHVRRSASQGISYMAIPAEATATTDDVSEKTTEIDNPTPEITSPYAPGRHQRQRSVSNGGALPSYMTPTQSAKAKVRSQGATAKQQRIPTGPRWNTSTKRGSSISSPGYDSSSSGTISSAIHQTPRSPKAKVNGPHRRAASLREPVPIYMDEPSLPSLN